MLTDIVTFKSERDSAKKQVFRFCLKSAQDLPTLAKVFEKL
jgi:hypothetical protein